MAGKVLEFELEYRDSGKLSTDILEISFISNWCVKEYNSIMKIFFDVKMNSDMVSEINTKIASIKKTTKNKEEIQELEAEKEECLKLIMVYSEAKIENRRFDLIKIILEDNDIKEEIYHDFNFWDRKVDIKTQLNFLTACAFKDIDIDKKKAPVVKSSTKKG